jgi:DNA-directed RNA polymerase specialized sigma24 family protein
MGVAVVWQLSDESLLAGLGSGDPDAAADFVRRFQRRVFGLTFSILRDRAAAEEAAQESFVRAWRHASAYDPRRGTVAAWLLTIARNVSINMLPTRRFDPIDPEALLALEASDHTRTGPRRRWWTRSCCGSRWLASPATSGERWSWPSSTGSRLGRSANSTACRWAR